MIPPRIQSIIRKIHAGEHIVLSEQSRLMLNGLGFRLKTETVDDEEVLVPENAAEFEKMARDYGILED